MILDGTSRLVSLAFIASLAAGCASPQAVMDNASDPEPSASSRSSAPIASPSAVPSSVAASPAPSATEPALTDQLGPASTAITTADAIRLRAGPSTSATEVNVVPIGSRVIILSGPAADPADPSLEWWEVLPDICLRDGCSVDPRPGWMTSGPNRDWLQLEQLDCPATTTVTAESADWLLQCFGNEPIMLEGIVDYWCCRGITFGHTEPAWLAGDSSNSLIAKLRVSADVAQSWGPELHLAPGSGVTLPERGSVVRIVGHVDDAAAQTCRTTVTEEDAELNPDLAWVTSESLAVYACRTKFVVDAADVLDFIELATHPPQY